MHGHIERWLDLTAEYRLDIISRKGEANLPPNYLSRQPMNFNDKPEIMLEQNKAQDLLFEEELVSMLTFLQSLETGSVDRKVLDWVRGNT